MGIIQWVKDVFGSKSLRVGIQPDLNKIKRNVCKYFQNSYNGETGYLSTAAINFQGVDFFSMEAKDVNNLPIERVMKITKRDYYHDFGYKCIMLNYKRTNFIINS